eukprot:COSAG01_NODE_186_length_22652_cov_7.562630_2_plen_155_part_00
MSEAQIEACRREVAKIDAALERLQGRENTVPLSRWLTNGIVRRVLCNVNAETTAQLRLAELATTTDCNRHVIRSLVKFRRYYALKNKSGCERAAERYARYANQILDTLMFEDDSGIAKAIHVSPQASDPMRVEGDGQIARTTGASTSLKKLAHS